jgi:hypothetical protein
VANRRLDAHLIGRAPLVSHARRGLVLRPAEASASPGGERRSRSSSQPHASRPARPRAPHAPCDGPRARTRFATNVPGTTWSAEQAPGLRARRHAATAPTTARMTIAQNRPRRTGRRHHTKVATALKAPPRAPTDRVRRVAPTTAPGAVAVATSGLTQEPPRKAAAVPRLLGLREAPTRLGRSGCAPPRLRRRRARRQAPAGRSGPPAHLRRSASWCR